MDDAAGKGRGRANGRSASTRKADLYPAGADEIEAHCRDNGIETVGRIPFDPMIASAMVAGAAVTAFRPEAPAAAAIAGAWGRIVDALAARNPEQIVNSGA